MAGHAVGDAVYVSRLRWDRSATIDHAFEVPHVGGVPVEEILEPGTPRVREWPNVCGILEPGAPGDTVLWRPMLAARPAHGRVEIADGWSDATPPDLGTRTKWFRRLLKQLKQIPGIDPYVDPHAPCGVLITPGIRTDQLHGVPEPFRSLVHLPDRALAEFAGGLQIVLDDRGWSRRDEYAAYVEKLLREGD